MVHKDSNFESSRICNSNSNAIWKRFVLIRSDSGLRAWIKISKRPFLGKFEDDVLMVN